MGDPRRVSQANHADHVRCWPGLQDSDLLYMGTFIGAHDGHALRDVWIPSALQKSVRLGLSRTSVMPSLISRVCRSRL